VEARRLPAVREESIVFRRRTEDGHAAARVVAEPSTAVAEYESGNVDLLQIPAAEASDWMEDESRKPMLMSTPALELVYVGSTRPRGPLVDPRVRQAINYAIDVSRIIERSSADGARAAGVVPPALGGYDSTRKPYPYDPRKARQLLAAAGHPEWHRHRALDLDDADLSANRLRPYRRTSTRSAFRVKIVQRESAAARGAARKGQTDMILKDWYADYPDAEDFLYPLLHSANKGVGWKRVVLFESALRLVGDRVASRARRNQAQRALQAGGLDRLRRGADGLSLLL
jgi:peptide/nickel transport system substrate-binding protein/oligopeptide transport system substrate-binding protein